VNELRYEQLVSRNAGYVSEDLQSLIRKTRLLIAGCGIGSTIAEACVRLGFQHLTLIDKDQVEAHNLNRQNFTAADIGTQKVDALARRLLSINPSASISAINEWVTPQNAADFVGETDIVLDTIDFLSLEGIVALHDAGGAQKKPIIAPLSVGWGAAAIYFPPDGTCTFRDIFGLPASGPVGHISYVGQFMRLIDRLEPELSEDVVAALRKTLTRMDDGRPCPAPHVSVGSWAVGSLAAAAAVRVLRGEPITAAPRMIFVNMSNLCTTQGIDLLAEIKEQVAPLSLAVA
jgi:molybdopterin-synthase adenylyltransferase